MFARVFGVLATVAVVLLVVAGMAVAVREYGLVELLVNLASADLLALMIWGIVAIPHPDKVRQ